MQLTEALPTNMSGKIRTKGRIFLDEWTDTLTMLGGMIIALGVGSLCFDTSHHPKWKTTIGVICVVGGVGLTVLSYIVQVGMSRSLLPNMLLRRAARRVIKRRPDRIVDPDDPDARFVEEVSSKRRERPSLRKATDIGFLRVDSQQGIILFEGDKVRCRIPAGSIISCKQESTLEYEKWVGGAGQTTYTKMQHLFVTMAVKNGDRTDDAAFLIVSGRGALTAGQRAAANLALLHQIHQLQMPPNTSLEPTPTAP